MDHHDPCARRRDGAVTTTADHDVTRGDGADDDLAVTPAHDHAEELDHLRRGSSSRRRFETL